MQIPPNAACCAYVWLVGKPPSGLPTYQVELRRRILSIAAPFFDSHDAAFLLEQCLLELNPLD